MAGSWHPRYFAVRGDVLEYFKEEAAKIHADTDRDFVMTAAEAVTYGIIDEVIDQRNLADNSGPIAVVDASRRERGVGGGCSSALA